MNNNILTVSDLVDIDKIKEGKINMVVAGCGTGKSYFAFKTLPEKLNVRPEEILVVTSRTITKDQQKDDKKYNIKEVKLKDLYLYYSAIENESLNNNVRRLVNHERKVHICTYNYFSQYILESVVLPGIKIIIFDEIHSLLTDIMYNKTLLNVWENIDTLIKDKVIIGMTATDIEIKENRKLRRKLNYLLDEPFYLYKIQNTFNIVTKTRYINNILNNLQGNTLYMTLSTKDALKVGHKENSRCIISQYHEANTEEMEELRKYIKKYKMLPNDCNMLAGTSCIREGFEFKEESNINNVVIESSDPNTIIQFIGRYRGNINNVYIVYNYYSELKKYQDNLTHSQKIYHNEFKRLINYNNMKWTKYFSNVVNKDTIKFNIIKDAGVQDNFIMYINNNWLDKLIYTKEDKEIIVSKSIEYGLNKDETHKHTFNSLMKYLESEGYHIHKKIKKVKGIKYTSYTIKSTKIR